MKKGLILATIFFTIFLDFFNLGLIYPIFTSLVFEGNGNLILLESSEFYKNAIFGVLVASFPFGQFVGPFAIDRFGFNITEVGYLYANIGIAVSLGHIFLTRRLANRCSSEQALIWSLLCLAILIAILLFSNQVMILHAFTFLVMLACAVWVAVSIQSCAEFLPATILGLIAFISQALPLLTSALLASSAYLILRTVITKAPEKVSS